MLWDFAKGCNFRVFHLIEKDLYADDSVTRLHARNTLRQLYSE